MQRKQQVGECWVCVIFFACVCVGTSDMKTASDDPSSSVICVMCTGAFLGGSQGGQVCPPWLRTTPQNFFWVIFAIFRGFVN
jgi:hypothetical protein